MTAHQFKGRLRRSEAVRLKEHRRYLMRQNFTEAAPAIFEQVFSIVNAWAASQFPQADLEVLRRYKLVDDVTVVNVTAFNEATKLWDLRYGFTLPEGKTIPMPSDGYRSTYKSLYSRDIPALIPFCEEIERQRAHNAAEEKIFTDFVDNLPLRREFAERYPDIVKSASFFGM
jgi:hypothetical protein